MPDISLKCWDDGFTKSSLCLFECEIFLSLMARTNLTWLGEQPEPGWGSPSGRRAQVEVGGRGCGPESLGCRSVLFQCRLGDVAGESWTPPASHSPLQSGMISPTSWDCESTLCSTVETQHGIVAAKIIMFSRIPNSRCAQVLSECLGERTVSAS